MPVWPGPHTQLLTVVPSAGCKHAVNVFTAAAQGAKEIVPFAPVAMACVVTSMRAPPATPGLEAVVAMEFTYFVPEPAETSQPQPFAPIVAPDDDD